MSCCIVSVKARSLNNDETTFLTWDSHFKLPDLKCKIVVKVAVFDVRKWKSLVIPPHVRTYINNPVV